MSNCLLVQRHKKGYFEAVNMGKRFFLVVIIIICYFLAQVLGMNFWI